MVHHVYAIIDVDPDTNTGLVSNVLVGEDSSEAQRLADMCYINGVAMCVDDIAVHCGDFYDNGRFYKRIENKKGYEISRVPGGEEERDALEKIIESQKQEIEFLRKEREANGSGN